MNQYICRLMDGQGQVTSLLPIIADTEADAISTAKSVFKAHDQSGSFELWYGERRIAIHCEAGESGMQASPERRARRPRNDQPRV